MNKAALVRTLQFILLIFTLLSQLTLASASPMNSTQYSSSPTSISPSSSNINNSQFITSPAIEIASGITNSSQYSLCLGIKCTIPICGNNILESGESCDGTELLSQSCTTKGFSSGTLACNSDCSGFDTSSCILAGQPQQQSGPSGGEAAGRKGEETTTTSTTIPETTTTTTQPIEEEKPQIIDKAKELIRKTTEVLQGIEKRSKKLYIITLSITIVLGLYTLYLLIIITIRKIRKSYEEKKKKQAEVSKSSQQNERRKLVLKTYLKSNIEQGYTPSQLALILLQNNWPKEEIQQAIKEILQESRKNL